VKNEIEHTRAACTCEWLTWNTSVVRVEVDGEIVGTRLTDELAQSRDRQQTSRPTRTQTRHDWQDIAEAAHKPVVTCDTLTQRPSDPDVWHSDPVPVVHSRRSPRESRVQGRLHSSRWTRQTDNIPCPLSTNIYTLGYIVCAWIDDDDISLLVKTSDKRKCWKKIEKTEWLLLRRCNLSNIGGRVYVTFRVGVRVSVRVIFSITWPRPDMVTYVWQVAAS